MALYVGLWQYMLITEIKVLCVAFLIGYSLRDGAKTFLIGYSLRDGAKT